MIVNLINMARESATAAVRRIEQRAALSARKYTSDEWRALRAARHELQQLEAGLRLERAGRDVSSLDAELLVCFDQRGRHYFHTLCRRLYKADKYSYFDSTSAEGRLVHGALARLQRSGRVYEEMQERCGTPVYLLATPERKAARAVEAEAERARQAKRRTMRARRDAIIAKLNARGYASASARSTDRVTISVTDLERLVEVLCSE